MGLKWSHAKEVINYTGSHLKRANLLHKNVLIMTDTHNRPQTKFAKVMFSQVFVCPRGGGFGLCPGGVSVQGGLYLRGLCLAGSLSRGSLSGGSLSRGVSVLGISDQEGDLCPERGSLSRRGVSVWAVCLGGVSVQGVSVRETLQTETPHIWSRAGGTHPTGMHSCYI